MTAIGSYGKFTPYSTVTPMMDWTSSWAPEWERERVGSYQKYEEIYWNNPTTFRILERGTDVNPIYIPNARTIVDSTAFFLMKDMSLVFEDEQTQKALDEWLAETCFYNKFHIAKHSGVVRGDYIFHILGDPEAPQGQRVTIETVDPGSYFPIYSDDDPDEVLGVDLVDVFQTTDRDSKLLRQRYRYEKVNGKRLVSSELLLMKLEDWWDDEKGKELQTIIAKKLLPESITKIPVYAFKNIDWQGNPYGSSELRGFERVLASVNQSAADEDVALALEGLGVYATDAPLPKDAQGNEMDWEIAPGFVAGIPPGTKFERVQGVGSVTPMQDHIKYLEDSMMTASGTFRPDQIEVQVAQSGIALAIRFMPTLAKITQRETETTEKLQNLIFDWASWQAEYENVQLSMKKFDLRVKLGDKLPKDPVARINELNNMLDRKVISAEYYREVMTKEFGYKFPDDIASKILAEQKAVLELQQQFAPVQPNGSGGGGPSDQSGKTNRSNNKTRPNESAGTEAK